MKSSAYFFIFFLLVQNLAYSFARRTPSYKNQIVIDAYRTLEHEISSLMPRLFTPMKCPKQTSVQTTPNGCTDLFKRASDSSVTKDPTGESELPNDQYTVGVDKFEKLMGSKISNFFKIARAEDEEFNRVVNSAFENTELSQDQINRCLSRYLFYTSMTLYSPIPCMESLSTSNLEHLKASKAFRHAGRRLSTLYQDSFYKSREIKENLNTALSKVKAITSSLISSSITPSSLAEKITEKINNIQMDNSLCLRSGYAWHVNASYYPNRNKIAICSQYILNSTSEFTLIHVMAHEIAHSIDPCEISKIKGVESNIYESTLRCLKRTGLILNENKNCDQNTYEGFCDFLASKVLPIYFSAPRYQHFTPNDFQNGYANALKNILQPYTLTEPSVESYDSHPSVQKRYKLLMQTPAIRRQMGCEDLQSETSCEL